LQKYLPGTHHIENYDFNPELHREVCEGDSAGVGLYGAIALARRGVRVSRFFPYRETNKLPHEYSWVFRPAVATSGKALNVASLSCRRYAMQRMPAA
jgi:hypothetical protein